MLTPEHLLVASFLSLSLWNLNNQLSPLSMLKFCNNLTRYASIFTHRTEHLVDPFSLATHFLQFWKIILTYSLNIFTMVFFSCSFLNSYMHVIDSHYLVITISIF